MEFYLTENIILRDNKTYFKERYTDKLKKLNNNNWHHYLGDFGWFKLPFPWIKELNKVYIELIKNQNTHITFELTS